MKNRILVLTTVGFLATIVACNQQTTPEISATTAGAETSAPAYPAAAATDVATPVPDGGEQIAEGAKLVGRGLKEEAQQAMAASGAALERGGEQIAEGARLVGKGLKEEAQQAMAASGAALERGGEQLQESAAAVVPQSTEPAKQPAAEPPSQGSVADGAAIFKAKCASCHGADAGGDTAMGKKHNILDLRSSVVQDLTDAELATVIAEGKPDGLSASAHKSKAPTADQMKDVIAYLRSIRM